MLCDLPYKVLNALTYNITLYFMSHLRREAGAFFVYLLFTFFTTLCMSMIFRTIASASRTLSQAMVPAALLILALVTFSGFVVPIDYMLGWCRWINYINPLAYAFESLIVNEFHGRDFVCTQFVPNQAIPGYEDIGLENQACSAVGAIKGLTYVAGNDYINSAFKYYHAHKWRNFGILIAFTLFFLFTYMLFAEIVSAKKSKGEVLVFRRGHGPIYSEKTAGGDVESTPANSGPAAITEKHAKNETEVGNIQRSTSVFHWNNLCYEVQIKTETRRILDNVAGYVKPGTMTALMVSD